MLCGKQHKYQFRDSACSHHHNAKRGKTRRRADKENSPSDRQRVHQFWAVGLEKHCFCLPSHAPQIETTTEVCSVWRFVNFKYMRCETTRRVCLRRCAGETTPVWLGGLFLPDCNHVRSHRKWRHSGSPLCLTGAPLKLGKHRNA